MELIKNTTKDKLRGGFYTPTPIVQFILKWASLDSSLMEILEPSCGDGIFLKELKKNKYPFKSILGIEFDENEADKSRKINLRDSKIITADFHEFCNTTDKKFDLIVGNPPYIRYQYFDRIQQQSAMDIFKKAGLKYSKLTNAWVSFIVGSILLLKENGKIGFVVPAEILQVSFAKTIRKFLVDIFNKISIVSFEQLVFPDIQQEVVLLLCEKNNSNQHNIEHIEVQDLTKLNTLDISKLRQPKKRIDFHSNKWTFYFLNQKEIDFIEEIKGNELFKTLDEFAKVEVGITTGANPYFTVPYSIVEKYDLQRYAKKMVGRSVQVPSAIFTEKDWEFNRDNDVRAHLLVFPKKENINGHRGIHNYLELGAKTGINKGYKCSIRDEWQIVPSLWISDALFIRRNNIFPKFILNEAKAYTTDTMHRVQINSGINQQALIASYYNSLSLAFTEISGRSHGGGVLELMPNEVENILIPYNENNFDLLIEIDLMLRKKVNILQILEYTNQQILHDNYGFSKNDIVLANNIWKKLSNRRLKRGKKLKNDLRS